MNKRKKDTPELIKRRELIKKWLKNVDLPYVYIHKQFIQTKKITYHSFCQKKDETCNNILLEKDIEILEKLKNYLNFFGL